MSGRIMRRLIGGGLGIAAWLAAATPVSALTISFQEGVSNATTVNVNVQDAELRSSAPDDSFEQNPRWNIGTCGPVERDAVAFPISLPVGAVVTGVTLDVWQNGDSFGAHKTLNIHEITNLNFTFEGQNLPTQIDGVTWNSAN